MKFLLIVIIILSTTNMLFANRYYSADNGRFLNRDPISYVDGLSLYANYFDFNYLDPLGLLEFDPSQLPDGNLGQDKIRELLRQYGKEWSQQFYDWARRVKKDKKLAQDIKTQQKYLGYRGSSGGPDKKKGKGDKGGKGGIIKPPKIKIYPPWFYILSETIPSAGGPEGPGPYINDSIEGLEVISPKEWDCRLDYHFLTEMKLTVEVCELIKKKMKENGCDEYELVKDLDCAKKCGKKK